MREKKLTIAAVFLVCLGLLTYLVVFSVRVDQVAAQYRLGTPIRIIRPILGEKSDEEAAALAKAYPKAQVVTHAGWFWKLPWPFDKVEKFDQRVRNVDGPAAQTQLPDGNHIIPRVYATWRIYDPVAFQKSLSGDLGNAEDRLRNIIGNETTSVFGNRNLDDVVNTDPKRLQFDQIEQAIYQGVRARLNQSADSSKESDAYGIEVLSLGIERIALPNDTTKAVFGRMIAERQRVAGTLVAEGQRIKRTKIAEAKQEQDTILAKAEAQAKDIRAQGEAEAAQYYQVFAKNEQLAVFLRRLESLRKIATAAAKSGNPITLVLSAKTPPFDTLESGPRTGKEEGPPPLPLAQDGSSKDSTKAPASEVN